MRHVYVHVPFCASKCPYCDFNSHAGRDGEQGAYVAALLEEARRRARGAAPRTVFVGGGTPTHLDAARLDRLLDGLFEVLDPGAGAEITIEANPGSLDREKVRVLRALGVNRLSLGVQSFDDRLLATLGRAHDARDAVRSASLAKDGGIERLSVDLILAIPGQSLADQERDLARALDLEPEHVSAYVLTLEPGTAFARRAAEGRFAAPDDTRDLAHLHLAIERLAAAGFDRYEVSNFARGAGAECAHNVAYWLDEDWIGLGAGAHSHEGPRRWKNVDDPARYARCIEETGDATAWRETTPPALQAFEALMMGLRLVRGVDLRRIREHTGHDLQASAAERIDTHVATGLLVRAGSTLRATDAGLDVLSGVLRDLLPEAEASREILTAE